MKEYNLTKEDYEQIKEIIQVTTSIDNIYIELYNLEVSDEKDTNEYKRALEKLKKEIELEDKLYKEYKVLNINKSISWSKYLVTEKVSNSLPNNIESLMLQSYNDRIIRRILNILSNTINSDSDRIRNMVPEEFEILLSSFGEENPEKVINESIRSSIAITDALEIDLFNTYLSILKEMISNKTHHYYNKQLISSKYNLTFLNKTIEKAMLSNNFDIHETLYITSKLISDMYGVTEDAYEILKDNNYSRIIAEQISEILEISDLDYNSINHATTSILRQCLLRAAFSLTSEDNLEEYNYTFHEFIESKEFLERHQYDKLGTQLIINCFKSVKKDKTKHNTLCLKPRKK